MNLDTTSRPNLSDQVFQIFSSTFFSNFFTKFSSEEVLPSKKSHLETFLCLINEGLFWSLSQKKFFEHFFSDP